MSSKIYTYGTITSGEVGTGETLILMGAPADTYLLVLKSILCVADGFTWTKFAIQLADPHATPFPRVNTILGFDWIATSGPIPNGGTLNWQGTLPLRPSQQLWVRTFHGFVNVAVGWQILEYTPGFTPHVPPTTGG